MTMMGVIKGLFFKQETNFSENPPDEWSSLDYAAQSILRPHDITAFYRYKQMLKNEGHKWTGDAEDILRGFIWDTIEFYDQ